VLITAAIVKRRRLNNGRSESRRWSGAAAQLRRKISRATPEQLVQFRQRVQAGQLGHAMRLTLADVLSGT
jgi:hypothetical protein